MQTKRSYELDDAWEYCKSVISGDVLEHVIDSDIHVMFDTKDRTFSHYRGQFVVASDDWCNPNPRFVEVYCFNAGDVDPAGDHHDDADEYSETEEDYNELFVESVLDQMQDQFYADHEEWEQEVEIEAAEKAVAVSLPCI